jgi:hypothetical protein
MAAPAFDRDLILKRIWRGAPQCEANGTPRHPASRMADFPPAAGAAMQQIKDTCT